MWQYGKLYGTWKGISSTDLHNAILQREYEPLQQRWLRIISKTAWVSQVLVRRSISIPCELMSRKTLERLRESVHNFGRNMSIILSKQVSRDQAPDPTAPTSTPTRGLRIYHQPPPPHQSLPSSSHQGCMRINPPRTIWDLSYDGSIKHVVQSLYAMLRRRSCCGTQRSLRLGDWHGASKCFVIVGMTF